MGQIHGKGGKIITPTLCLIEIKFKQGEDKNDEIPRISQKRLLYSMETWGWKILELDFHNGKILSVKYFLPYLMQASCSGKTHDENILKLLLY